MSNYVFYDGELLERAGGPSTYLYNLRDELLKTKKNDYKFITRKKQPEYKKKKLYKKLKQTAVESLPRVYEKVMIKHYLNEGEIFKSLAEIQDMELVHFHSTSNFVKAKKYLKKDVITLLMSHSPEITSKQVAQGLRDKYKGKYDFKTIEEFYLNNFDIPAFKEADVLIFPSEEAMEPYYQTYNNFENIIKDKNIKYIMTGTKPLKYEIEKDEFRKQYNIPKEAIVICFVGRHNDVKGYDNFIQISQKLLEQNDNIYIVTAGIGPINSPKESRWIDLGWTNDPGSAVNASDVFVLPNKRTYFDLVLLEVLSLGKTCVVSNTGGNKTVAKITNGVITYDSIEQAVTTIMDLSKNLEKLNNLSQENINAYNSYFTVQKFAERYDNLIKEIKNEVKK